MKRENLNHLVAVEDGNFSDNPYMAKVNAQPTSDRAEVTCFFRDIEDHLCAVIREYPRIAGCTAWLTNPRVINALSGKETAFVVQKEDFLRPDAGAQTKQDLRVLYHRLRGLDRFHFSGVLNHTSVGSDYTIGVRCMGRARRKGQREPSPVMHHKFMLFGRPLINRLECSCWGGALSADSSPVGLQRFSLGEYPFPDERYVLNPECPVHNQDNPPTPGNLPDPEEALHDYWAPTHWEAVWTGSFNPTVNATFSLENAVLIRSPALAAAYAAEFEQIALMSEPLDWKSEWVDPEWRIGT